MQNLGFSEAAKGARRVHVVDAGIHVPSMVSSYVSLPLASFGLCMCVGDFMHVGVLHD